MQGPMFVLYNRVLREALVHELMRGAKEALRRWNMMQKSSRVADKGTWYLNEDAHEHPNDEHAAKVQDDVNLQDLVEWSRCLGLSGDGSGEQVVTRLVLAVEKYFSANGPGHKWKPCFVTTIQ